MNGWKALAVFGIWISVAATAFSEEPLLVVFVACFAMIATAVIGEGNKCKCEHECKIAKEEKKDN